jgi:hypothetical protein
MGVFCVLHTSELANIFMGRKHLNSKISSISNAGGVTHKLK